MTLEKSVEPNKMVEKQAKKIEANPINDILIFGRKDVKDYVYSWALKSEHHDKVSLESTMHHSGKMERIAKIMKCNGWEEIERKAERRNIKYFDDKTRKEVKGKVDVSIIIMEKMPAVRGCKND